MKRFTWAKELARAVGEVVFDGRFAFLAVCLLASIDQAFIAPAAEEYGRTRDMVEAARLCWLLFSITFALQFLLDGHRPSTLRSRLRAFGAAFVGLNAAVVMGGFLAHVLNDQVGMKTPLEFRFFGLACLTAFGAVFSVRNWFQGLRRENLSFDEIDYVESLGFGQLPRQNMEDSYSDPRKGTE